MNQPPAQYPKPNLWKYVSILLFVALTFTSAQYYTATRRIPLVQPAISNNSSASSSPSSDTLTEVKKLIESQYKGEGPTSQQVQDGITKGYVSALADKYSIFLTKKENDDLLSSIDEKYVGIGIAFNATEDQIIITRVFDGSPARDAGLVIGDAITAVGIKKVSQYTPTDAATADIKGPANTTVALTVLKKDGASTELTLARRSIQLPLTELTWANDSKTAIIRVNSFGSSLETEFAQDIKAIQAEPRAQHIAIDLRDNGGGYLESAVDIVSHFVAPGTLVVREETKKSSTEHKTSTKLPTELELPIAVLVNKNTASASEIAALALRELKNATVIGEKTFGKGVVQSIFSGNELFQDGQSLKLTTAEWLGPNNTKINQVGIIPDIILTEKQDALTVLTDSFDWKTKALIK